MSTSIKHIIISGIVQGVGFRRYVFQEAEKRNLKGWVRNLRDGRVEVLVELEHQVEDEFLQQLRKGPKFSRVENLDVKIFNRPISFESFTIKEDGSHCYA